MSSGKGESCYIRILRASYGQPRRHYHNLFKFLYKLGVRPVRKG